MTTDALLASDATGSEVYARALGIAGADHASSGLVLYPVFQLGQLPSLVKATGLLTLAETRAGLLYSTSAGSVIYTLPTFSQLGYTRVAGTTPELIFMFQRQGSGQLFVTPSIYRGSQPDQASMLGLSTAAVGDWCQRSDLSNAVYQLTALPASTLGNWVLRNGANAPSSAGITVHWQGPTNGELDPQYLNQFHPPVMLMTCGAGNDEWTAC